MNLFELFVRIGVDDQASGKLSKLSSSLGKGLATAAKIGTAAVGAASTAIVGLTTKAVNSFAEYEQLVGGVKTLFEDLSWDVQQNAGKAFETAGLSANEYMSTAMSFAASLNQSLLATEGNIARSAELTDQAIIDMADNANKMGTNMEMIQNAYQGFAKQNYTMLDNLKLGYGGTKTEMERLIKDAAELSDSVDKNSMSFANIVEAIHVMQTEMGISGITMEEYNELVASGAMTQEEAFELLGTTAKEASFTISGSVSSMKAAWSNLITGLADDEADFDSLMNNFVGSVKTVAGNIAPRIGIALNGVGKLIKEIVPVAMQYIPQIITEFLPTIGDAAIGIVTSIGTAIFDNIDQILEWGQQMLYSLLNGINGETDKISDVIFQVVSTIGNFILANMPEIIVAGFNLLLALASGLIDAIPQMASAATKMVVELAAYIISPENLEKLRILAVDLLNSLIEGFSEILDILVPIGTKIVDNIKKGISKAWNGLKTWFNNLWDSLFKNRSVDVNVNASSNGGGGGSFANGLSYVPYDGYYAILHEGERVLTAEENKAYNNGSSGNSSGITIIQNIQAVPQTPVEFAAATEAYFEQARWAF